MIIFQIFLNLTNIYSAVDHFQKIGSRYSVSINLNDIFEPLNYPIIDVEELKIIFPCSFTNYLNNYCEKEKEIASKNKLEMNKIYNLKSQITPYKAKPTIKKVELLIDFLSEFKNIFHDLKNEGVNFNSKNFYQATNKKLVLLFCELGLMFKEKDLGIVNFDFKSNIDLILDLYKSPILKISNHLKIIESDKSEIEYILKNNSREGNSVNSRESCILSIFEKKDDFFKDQKKRNFQDLCYKIYKMGNPEDYLSYHSETYKLFEFHKTFLSKEITTPEILDYAKNYLFSIKSINHANSFKFKEIKHLDLTEILFNLFISETNNIEDSNIQEVYAIIKEVKPITATNYFDKSRQILNNLKISYTLATTSIPTIEFELKLKELLNDKDNVLISNTDKSSTKLKSETGDFFEHITVINPKTLQAPEIAVYIELLKNWYNIQVMNNIPTEIIDIFNNVFYLYSKFFKLWKNIKLDEMSNKQLILFTEKYISPFYFNIEKYLIRLNSILMVWSSHNYYNFDILAEYQKTQNEIENETRLSKFYLNYFEYLWYEVREIIENFLTGENRILYKNKFILKAHVLNLFLRKFQFAELKDISRENDLNIENYFKNILTKEMSLSLDIKQ